MLADFVALDRDILSPAVAPTIWAAVVLGTYLDGAAVFQRDCWAGAAQCPRGGEHVRAKLRLGRAGDDGCPH